MNTKKGRPKIFGFNSVVFLGNVIFATLFLSACNSQPKSTEESTESISAATDTTTTAKQDWEVFKQDANHQIADANDSISAFKIRIKKLNGKIKAKYEKEVVILQERNDELKARLDSFKVESKDKWDDFKMKFNDDMAKIKASLRDSTDVNQK